MMLIYFLIFCQNLYNFLNYLGCFNSFRFSSDGKSKRLFAEAEALSLGKSNISLFSRAMDISEETIKKGYNALESGESLSNNKIRVPGGGRKKGVEKDSTLLSDLETLIEPTSRGDPESPLRWTSKVLVSRKFNF
jgi:hypothetical protein